MLAAVTSHWSLSVTDVVLLVGLGALGLLSLRYRVGGFWRQTAEERGARIAEIEEAHSREVSQLTDRVTALERKNHEQAVQIAQLEARPNMDGLYELLQRHDERAAEAFATFKQETAEITAVLHSIHVVLGETARQLKTELT